MSHVFYRHFRMAKFIKNHGIIVAPTGGITLRCERLDEKTDVPDQPHHYQVSFALVNQKDLYCKKTGRDIADKREHAFELNTSPGEGINDAFVRVLGDESTDFPLKRRLSKKVRELIRSNLVAKADELTWAI